MKIRKRLSEEKALQLGLKVKPIEKCGKNPRYYLTEKQVAQLGDVKNEVTSKTSANNYNEPLILSAWSDKGRMMSIDEYCEHYNLPRKDITSYKLVSHTGTPYYNIVFKEQISKDDFDYKKALKQAFKDFKKYEPEENKYEDEVDTVVTLADLHFGAYVSASQISPEYSITVLCDMLEYAAEKANTYSVGNIHVHLLGDLIESFTGLNHKNSWKGLDKGMFGVSAVKLFVELFKKHFLDNLISLGSIKMVAGNHDRVTSDSSEDTDGGAAELVAWGLEMLGYDVEFSTSVLTHLVDDTNYILNHGHLGLTKKMSTKELCWTYGKKGYFNYIQEAHLHSRIRKLNAKQVQGFQLISDDNNDCRREVFPSFFTGNPYSENLGFSTMPGFKISMSGRGRGVDVFDFSL